MESKEAIGVFVFVIVENLFKNLMGPAKYGKDLCSNSGLDLAQRGAETPHPAGTSHSEGPCSAKDAKTEDGKELSKVKDEEAKDAKKHNIVTFIGQSGLNSAAASAISPTRPNRD